MYSNEMYFLLDNRSDMFFIAIQSHQTDIVDE